mmetsp:Transcript_39144/g.76374  ORF Transcript_39144/g.76374 Transcript_39144/m.76374 type:complete len:359 (+) Transcript_39144:57-1133(+)
MGDEKKIDGSEKPLTENAWSGPEEDNFGNIARELFEDDKILSAGKILRKVPSDIIRGDKELLSIANTFGKCESVVNELLSDPDTNDNANESGWKRQAASTWWQSPKWGESTVKYKLDEQTGTKLTALISTPVDRSLLVPLLSVLNESELYSTWMPNWSFPIRLKVRRSLKLQQTGRCSQVVLVTIDMPLGMAPREVVLEAVAIDGIDGISSEAAVPDNEEEKNGIIAVRLDGLHTGDKDGLVPSPIEENTVRCDMKGGFLFRKCPRRHKESSQDGCHEVLVSFIFSVDPKFTFVPKTLMNFIIRTVIGMVWNKLLKVAEEVLNKKRPEHSSAIDKKRVQLYDWIDSRVNVMLSEIPSD